jgi:acetyltransferase
MFGLGGIYVEILKDVSFRIAPFGKAEAKKMISQINSYPLLIGVRGEKGVDQEAAVDALLRLGQLMQKFPQFLEIDINPLILMPKDIGGGIVVDARFVI